MSDTTDQNISVAAIGEIPIVTNPVAPGAAAPVAQPALSASPTPATYFAPAGRDQPDELQRKAEVVESVPVFQQTLDAMPTMVVILNSSRQIVAANRSLCAALGVTVGEVLGKRPGEAVECIRAKEGPDGCGTSQYCAACGAIGAILESQDTLKKVVRECRILVERPTGTAAMDLQVTATPLSIGAETFIVLAIADTSQANRLAVLQRIFFHDVLNTAGCIQGYAQYLVEETPENQEARAEVTQLTDT